MNTIAFKSNGTKAFLTILFTIGLFITSTMQSHAAQNSDAIQHMEGQLNVAEKVLTSMMAMFTPQGEVLGVSTTSPDRQAQIDALRAKISRLNASTSTKPVVRTECGLSMIKSGKDNKGSVVSSVAKSEKSGECKGNELARLIAAQKEIDVRIVQLQAKSSQIKARIAAITAHTGTGSTTPKNALLVSYVNDAVVAVENDDTITTDNAADFTLKFSVQSTGSSVYLPFGATSSSALVDGVKYEIVDTNTNAVVTTGVAISGLTASPGQMTNSWKVGGSNGQFTLTANYDPTVAGSYKLRLAKVNFASSDLGTATNSQGVAKLSIETAPVTIAQ